ncbi:MAG: DegT/DnrJ/EryC1/StrS aminotransferase family protein [Acidimicrobiales bacterium]|nr:DegT/DnrJ/EryC1/StrS aminotransferase family protein [Acidimicrobiales bacterium]
MKPPLPFIDLAAQRQKLGKRIDERIKTVLDHGSYLMGPEIEILEQVLVGRSGRRHCISCASGTDALQMAMMALGVGPGDRVIVPDFTFIATAEAVRLVGAQPVFADIDAMSYCLSLDSVESIFEDDDSTIVGVITVDLFGHPSQSRQIEDLAGSRGAWLIVDAAQSFGATRGGESCLAPGVMSTTSFYPSKPLGGYGDGGAIFCDDDGLAGDLRSIRVHGSGEVAGSHDRLGITGRLDTIQAAVLLTKLEVFDQELECRQKIASRFGQALGESIRVPSVEDGATSVWAQYTVEVDDRDEIRQFLNEVGIPTCVFYPRRVSTNLPYRSFELAPDGVPVAERATSRVMSLPMHPYLTDSDQDRIVSELLQALEN